MNKIEKTKIIDILSMSFNSLTARIGGNKSSTVHKRNKSYPFIPYISKIAVEQLLMTFDFLGNGKPWIIYNKKKFLDAGCGIGNIMLLAQAVGFIAYGLEIDPTLIRTAKKVNKQIPHHIIKQNIMTYKKYDEYDVIYYFCPFSCYEKEVKFEERVENQMKVGAVLIPNYKQSNKIMKDKRFHSIVGNAYCNMYVKKSK